MAHLGRHLEGLQGFLQPLGAHGVLLRADACLGLRGFEQIHAGIDVGRGKFHLHLLCFRLGFAGRQLQLRLPGVPGGLLLQPGGFHCLRARLGRVLPGRGLRPGGQGLLLPGGIRRGLHGGRPLGGCGANGPGGLPGRVGSLAGAGGRLNIVLVAAPGGLAVGGRIVRPERLVPVVDRGGAHGLPGRVRHGRRGRRSLLRHGRSINVRGRVVGGLRLRRLLMGENMPGLRRLIGIGLILRLLPAGENPRSAGLLFRLSLLLGLLLAGEDPGFAGLLRLLRRNRLGSHRLVLLLRHGLEAHGLPPVGLHRLAGLGLVVGLLWIGLLGRIVRGGLLPVALRGQIAALGHLLLPDQLLLAQLLLLLLLPLLPLVRAAADFGQDPLHVQPDQEQEVHHRAQDAQHPAQHGVAQQLIQRPGQQHAQRAAAGLPAAAQLVAAGHVRVKARGALPPGQVLVVEVAHQRHGGGAGGGHQVQRGQQQEIHKDCQQEGPQRSLAVG